MRAVFAMIALAAAFWPAIAVAQPLVAASGGDIAWVLAGGAGAGLLLTAGFAMLAFAHGGCEDGALRAVRVAAAAAAAALLWTAIGYGLVFGPGSEWLGSFGNLFLAGLDDLYPETTVPERAFALVHLATAVAAAALFGAAISARVGLPTLLALTLLWTATVHIPVTRWIAGGGWLATLGVLDYAGALGLFAAAGTAALVAVRLLGSAAQPDASYRPGLALGAGALLWAGATALVAASALGATAEAATTLVTTLAAAAAGFVAGLLVWRGPAGAGVRGGVDGGVAGLAAAVAGAAYVGISGMILLAAIAALLATSVAKRLTGTVWDGPSLVPALSSAISIILVPFYILPALGGPGYQPGYGPGGQFLVQVAGVAAVTLWSALMTAVICMIIITLRDLLDRQPGTASAHAGHESS